MDEDSRKELGNIISKFWGDQPDNEGWSVEIPECSGWFWHFGCPYKSIPKPELSIVQVRRAGSGKSKFWMYIRSGSFWFPKDEAGTGWWQRIAAPSIF